MNATASASVSRTVAVVMVRRSALCRSSCAISCTSVDELLGLRLSRQQGDLAAVADAERGAIFSLYSSAMFWLCEKCDQPVAVLAHFAGDVVLELGQVRSFGLRHIEYVHGAEADQHGRGFASVLLLCRSSFLRRWPTIGARIWMPFSPFFTNRPSSFHVRMPATRVAVGRCPAICENVPEGIGMEPGHRAKVGGQGFALARLKLLDEEIHGLLDELLCGVVFLGGALLVRRLAAVLPCRIFPVRRGLLISGCGVAAEWLLIAAAMVVLLCCPRGADWRSEARAPKPNFFVECPRFMALATGGGGRFCQGRALVAVHRSAAETLDRFFRLCQARCLKRGHSDEEENWLLSRPHARIRESLAPDRNSLFPSNGPVLYPDW